MHHGVPLREISEHFVSAVDPLPFFRPVCALRWTERAMAVHAPDAG
jgi:hypothetical protein